METELENNPKKTSSHQYVEMSNFLNNIISLHSEKTVPDYKTMMEYFYSDMGKFPYLYDEKFIHDYKKHSEEIKNQIERFQMHLYDFSCCVYRCTKKSESYNVDKNTMIFTGLGKLCDWNILKLTFDSHLSNLILKSTSNDALNYINITGAVFAGIWDGLFIWNSNEIMKRNISNGEKVNRLRAEMGKLFIRKGSKLTSDAIMIYVPSWPEEEIVYEVGDVL